MSVIQINQSNPSLTFEFAPGIILFVYQLVRFFLQVLKVTSFARVIILIMEIHMIVHDCLFITYILYDSIFHRVFSVLVNFIIVAKVIESFHL